MKNMERRGYRTIWKYTGIWKVRNTRLRYQNKIILPFYMAMHSVFSGKNC